MTFEIEHKPGTSMEDVRKADREFIKDQLAISLGWTRDKLDDSLESIKEFLTLEEKNKRLNK